ncbi:MAG: DNA polymerase IV [Candidatus Bathyarchaeota archaeon]|nr:DNA polymerase IV [Candidatus Bathyarchaeota archaeon]
MVPTQARIVMLVDLDYFFAQCEELRNPALKGKPVVVGMYSGRTETSGAVSTSNYLAREFGVKSGIPLFLAQKRLEGKDAVFLPVDYDYYQQLSDKIMSLLRSFSDVLEQASIDEAYLDVTKKTEGTYEKAEAQAQEMKATVKREVGVTFSVGIAPNKLIAKIASNVHKPDGVTVVRPEQVKAFLLPLPVDAILGVGKKTVAKMSEMGIKTVGDLAKFDVQRLVEVFGKTLGVYFHNAAHGVDNDPVQEAGEAESIGRMGTLKEDSRDLDFIMEKINQQIEEVYVEFTQKSLLYRQVGITAVMTDLSAKSRSKTLEKPAKDKETIHKAAWELFEKYLGETDMEIRRVGVRVASFSKEEPQQQLLTRFFQPKP